MIMKHTIPAMMLHYEELVVYPNVQASKMFAASLFSQRFHGQSLHPQEKQQMSERTI